MSAFAASQSSLPPLPGTRAERDAHRRAVADVKAIERTRRYFAREEVPGVESQRLASTILALTLALDTATELRDELERRLHASAAAQRGQR